MAIVIPAVAFPALACSAVVSGLLLGWSGTVTFVMGTASLVCLVVFAIAFLHGGWPRVRSAFRKKRLVEETDPAPDRIQTLARGPAWKRTGVFILGMALVASAVWGAVSRSMHAHIVVKLLSLGAGSLVVSARSMGEARKRRVGP